MAAAATPFVYIYIFYSVVLKATAKTDRDILPADDLHEMPSIIFRDD